MPQRVLHITQIYHVNNKQINKLLDNKYWHSYICKYSPFSFAVILYFSSQPKVTNFDIHVIINEEISKFEISMDHLHKQKISSRDNIFILNKFIMDVLLKYTKVVLTFWGSMAMLYIKIKGGGDGKMGADKCKH